MRRHLAICGAVVISVAMLAGPFTHALVPHEHGHAHEATSAIWGEQHGALRHEDKIFLAPLISGFLMLVSLFLVAFIPRGEYRLVRVGDDRYTGSALRCGRLQHRKFT